MSKRPKSTRLFAYAAGLRRHWRFVVVLGASLCAAALALPSRAAPVCLGNCSLTPRVTVGGFDVGAVSLLNPRRPTPLSRPAW